MLKNEDVNLLAIMTILLLFWNFPDPLLLFFLGTCYFHCLGKGISFLPSLSILNISFIFKLAFQEKMRFKVPQNQIRSEKVSQHLITRSKLQLLSHVQLFSTLWTVARQAPVSMGFFRQECWSGYWFLSPRDLPNRGVESGSPALRADSLPSEPPGKPACFHAGALFAYLPWWLRW